MENQTEETHPAPRPRCKNCGEKMSKHGKFCPGCGQRDFDGRMRMRDLLSKFFSSFTHLDNKFVKMSWQLFVPAKVTLNYFKGQIKRYPNPVQFFFIVMFFFLLMFSKQFDGVALNILGGSISVGAEDSYTVKGKTVSRSNLMAALQRCIIAKEYRAAYDSLPISWRNEDTRRVEDSIHREVSEPWEEATRQLLTAMREDSLVDPNSLDTVSLLVGITKVRISTRDFASLEPDSIIRKYGIRSCDEKLMVRQGMKSIRDQRGLIHRYVGSFGWAVLVLIAFMALVLRLLYWKRRKYYVEHFIYMMHLQSGVFLFLTLVLVINEYLFPIAWGWFFVFGWLALSPLIAMRRYYGENWWRTIFKWLIYITIYVVGLIFLFVITMLVVFLIF